MSRHARQAIGGEMKAECEAKGSCRGSKAPKSQKRTSTQTAAVLCRRASVYQKNDFMKKINKNVGNDLSFSLV